MVKAMRNWSKKRRFFITKSGYFGLGSAILEPEDHVVASAAIEVSQILRNYRRFERLCGECFFYGIMKGEAFNGDAERTPFFIR